MNFIEMTGFEFEEYIIKVFKNKGFNVVRTPYSHDGGIDLVAISEEPIFCGKYIIQCKNWINPVGQPSVRDLYGVVVAERANKGILISTSEFTDEAYEFAKGKNLELINGKMLKRIIPESDINDEDCKQECSSFDDKQYLYIKDLINSEPTEPKNYLKMIKFLREYIVLDEECVSIVNVLEKLYNTYNELISKCYKGKSKEAQAGKQKTLIKIIELELIRGNIYNAVNLMLDNNWFYLTRWLPAFNQGLKNGFGVDYTVPYFHNENLLPKNLYSLFKVINFEEGCRLILSKGLSVNNTFRDVPNNIKEQYNNEYRKFVQGEANYDYFYYTDYEPFYTFCTKILEKKGSYTYFIKNYYKKTREEIINEVTQSFNQHGILF